ncbi:Uncharacterised protein [Serratia fonticola]|nr:Uncharacterised protein [Serratia fonticola]
MNKLRKFIVCLARFFPYFLPLKITIFLEYIESQVCFMFRHFLSTKVIESLKIFYYTSSHKSDGRHIPYSVIWVNTIF